MKLYYSPGACSFSTHIALTESKLPFTAIPVNLGTGHFKGGDFNKINPKGYVPTLELDNGEILTENAVLLQYIADQAPTSGLAPKFGTMERYRTMEWLNYIATEVHKGFGPLWNDASPETAKNAARENLKQKFDFISQNLKNKTFMTGNPFTIVDCYLYNMLVWTKILKLDMTPFPELMAYAEKIKSRPAVQEALKAEKAEH